MAPSRSLRHNFSFFRSRKVIDSRHKCAGVVFHLYFLSPLTRALHARLRAIVQGGTRARRARGLPHTPPTSICCWCLPRVTLASFISLCLPCRSSFIQVVRARHRCAGKLCKSDWRRWAVLESRGGSRISLHMITPQITD